MIRRTFQILPRVGPGKERTLWKEGIHDWDDFRECTEIKGMNEDRKRDADILLSAADRMLSEQRWRELSPLLPRQEHWRLYRQARDEVAFLDIETDGLGHDSTITVVGVHGPRGTDVLVKGRDLNAENLQRSLQKASMLVTFNGSCFDVPILRNNFPDLDWEIPHFDLRFGCRRLGITGGLKRIETLMGLQRDATLADVDGFEAVRLWNRWERRGDRGALHLLMEYNRADTVNLADLADIIYPHLEELCRKV
ncbi:MAG: ribonuclease H-like domain-containing protein [Candidatus Methanomethylophilaceae archaeon]